MLSRSFNSDDQLAFAELSGDYNDLHLDAIAARRSLFGSPVVHGINSLLWALDCCLLSHDALCEIVTLRVIFTRQIGVGEKVHIEWIKSESAAIKLKIVSADTPVATVKVEFRERKRSDIETLVNGCPEKVQPIELSREAIKSAHGDLELFLDTALLKQLYPNLAARMKPSQIAIILSSTRIVGVRCPGKFSLFSELELAAVDDNDIRTLTYKVASVDDRFGLVVIGLDGPAMSGVIRAFHRPAPQKQEQFTKLRDLVVAGEFARQRALIVGGSRGLGEVVAKLLAAGGADVKITYHQGQIEACELVSEIVANSGSACSFQFDVLNPKIAVTDVSRDFWYPTHLYYFATPAIFSAVGGKFSVQLFRKFCDFYVTGLMGTLNILGIGQIKQIFCPSSAAVDDPPLTMGEYAAAKSAGEMLGVFLQKAYPGMTVYEPRLPRLATDQTANVAAVENGNPVPLMLAELRAFQALAK